MFSRYSRRYLNIKDSEFKFPSCSSLLTLISSPAISAELLWGWHRCSKDEIISSFKLAFDDNLSLICAEKPRRGTTLHALQGSVEPSNKYVKTQDDVLVQYKQSSFKNSFFVEPPKAPSISSSSSSCVKKPRVTRAKDPLRVSPFKKRKVPHDKNVVDAFKDCAMSRDDFFK